MDEFFGKVLVRPATVNGKRVYILCGVLQSESPIEVNDRDEMWAVKMQINESIKFEATASTPKTTPEDFLENVNNIQDKRFWARKS